MFWFSFSVSFLMYLIGLLVSTKSFESVFFFLTQVRIDLYKLVKYKFH